MSPSLQQGPSAPTQSRRTELFALRPYQHAALAAVHREFEVARVRSTLLEQATGTGKTVEFAEFVRGVAMHDGRSLILVHRDELLKQAARKCEAAGLYVDIEKGKQRASTTARVVIASVQSLRGARLLRWARDHFDAIVVDEAHHGVSPGYRAIFDHFCEAKILGVTATAKRADGIGLGEVFESVAYTYGICDAIRDGYLVPITARRVVLEGVDLSAVRTRAGDLAQDELSAIMANERALHGVVDALLELVGARKTVVFGVDVAHATAIADELNRRRPGCARAVSGKTDDSDREELLAAFERGEFQFLTNCALLTEGWDCPGVECVAIARPTKSVGLYTQMVGRGTRLLGSTYAESCARGKHDMLLIAIGAEAGKHRLVSPADVLDGSMPDDLRAELDRLLGSAARPLAEVIAEATAAIGQQRVEIATAARVRWIAETIDPLIGAGESDVDAERDWSERLASATQIEALKRHGVSVAKLPPTFTQADAFRVLRRFQQRQIRGLCSFAQARWIAPSGIDTRTLSKARATELITILKARGGNPVIALHDQPEVIEARQKRAAQRNTFLEEEIRS